MTTFEIILSIAVIVLAVWNILLTKTQTGISNRVDTLYENNGYRTLQGMIESLEGTINFNSNRIRDTRNVIKALLGKLEYTITHIPRRESTFKIEEIKDEEDDS